MKLTDKIFRVWHKASFVVLVSLVLAGYPSMVKAQSAGTFTATGSMTAPRAGHTATLLNNGKVLIAGGGISAELYDPSTRTFTATGNMTVARSGQTATLLNDGRVLVAGGAGLTGITSNSAELYDPLTGTFSRTGNMRSARWGHTSTLLNSGKVLVAGGVADASFTSAEIYNPSTGTFSETGDMIRPRSRHTATLLNDGRVLIAGGVDALGESDEMYAPSTGNFTLTSWGGGVVGHTATLLNDGRVLIAGGVFDSETTNAGLFDPLTGKSTQTGSMFGTGGNLYGGGRAYHTATMLLDGRVLMTGGIKSIYSWPCSNNYCVVVTSDSSAEIYDPVARTFSSLENMTAPRASHTATLLSNGTVLIAGGLSDFQGGTATATAEIFNPSAGAIGSAQPGIVTTYAGPSPPVDGGLAIQYALDQPSTVAADGAGGFYVASEHRVYRVTSDGRIRAVAGNGSVGFSGDGGIATSAQLSYPSNVAIDAAGNLYISDAGRVRKVTLDGVIRTVAGDGSYGFSGDGGPATSAEFRFPAGVAIDAAGNLYISDIENNRIRKVTLDGVISTVAGNGISGFSGDGGPATSAMINSPRSIAMDAAGNLYIADFGNDRVRKVTPGGVISTVAGNGISGFSGDGGPATSAQIRQPQIAMDAGGNLYIADGVCGRIRKVTADGVIHTVAGHCENGFSGDGGQASAASFNFLQGIAVDSAGNLYIADTNNNRVRKVTLEGLIQTVAGNGSFGFRGDGGPASAALFNFPLGIAMDAGGNLYIADLGNNRVRKVTPGGVISTAAGNGVAGFSGDGGSATSAQLHWPNSVAVDAAGNLYIADSGNNRVRKVTLDGTIRTFSGNGINGFSGDGGAATSAQLGGPNGIAVDAAGNLYIADTENGRVRKVSPDGAIRTVAGIGTGGRPSGEGGPATSAVLNLPTAVAVDEAGNLYIADFFITPDGENFNQRVSRVTPDGMIRTVFTNNNDAFESIAVDASGNLYVADGYYVWEVTPGGVISRLATSASFISVNGIAVDASGNLFITDGPRIRRVAFGLIVNSITPNSGGRGNVFHMSLNGSNFDSSLVINPIDGVTVSNLNVVSPASATATFTIAAAAVPGARDVTVTTSGGTSNAITFTVDPPPGLAALAPPVGVPGTNVAMGLTGTGFRDGLTVDAGSGVTISNVGVTSATSAVATFTIAPDAALGPRNVTITTTDGTSAPATFNVVLPFPDLAIASTHSANFGVGFTETYNIRVRNVGLVATTGAMTIADVLPPGFTFVSGGGDAWTCSAAGQTVTCVRSEAQAAGASTTLDLLVAVSGAAAHGVVHAISVTTAGDLNPSNDSASDVATVSATPVPNFVISPSTLGAGAQATLALTLPTAFPYDVTGSVTLGFSSTAAIPQDDPAIQFASGGRQTTFVIPANTLEARFGGNPTAGPIGFQTGTVAGALSFSGTLQAGTVQTTFSPSNSVVSNLTIPKQAPSIRNMETRNENGFAVVINLLSTMREVTQMSLTFSTTPVVTLSCGSVSGCSVSGATMTFDVRSLFNAWFNSDTKFGSLTTLHLPFSISGAVHGTVTVRFQNSMGNSNIASFPLP